MLRALGVSFAVFVASLGLCAAEKTPPAVEVSDFNSGQPSPIDDQPSPIAVNNEQPHPQSNLTPGSSPGEDFAAENELLEAANKSREQVGLPPLRLEERLQEAARAHGRLMVTSKRLEHQLPGEPALLERIAQAISLDSRSEDGRPEDGRSDSALKIDRAGENVANATCAPGANDVLMRSAPHRKNLLDRGFNVAGFVAIWSEGRLYVVQDFAHEVPSYSAQQSRKLVGRAVGETRQQAGLQQLVELTPPDLDQAACSLAKENRPNAHLLAAAYDNRKIIAYTQSRPEVLPPGALRLLRDPAVRKFAVGSCYARNAAYPTGMYWVAILLY
jgi:uncharacterized protein YkwD